MDKKAATTISKDIIAELQEFAKARGLTITSEGGKFDSVSLTMKVKIAETEKAKEAQSSQIENLCKLYNIVPERNGIKLVDFKQRSWKRPFVYMKDGKRWVCDEQTIRAYLGKRAA
jgi:hypothetical protein